MGTRLELKLSTEMRAALFQREVHKDCWMGCNTRIRSMTSTMYTSAERDSHRYTTHCIWSVCRCSFCWTLSPLTSPCYREKDIQPSTLHVCSCWFTRCSSFCLYHCDPFRFLPFQFAFLYFSSISCTFWHNRTLPHLAWHKLQHSAYHALLSTQTHISFHSNNPTPCPRLLFSSLSPFHIYLSLILPFTFALLNRQASKRLFTWQWL